MCGAVVQFYEPCACSRSWVYNAETGRMEEVLRPCMKHLAEA